MKIIKRILAIVVIIISVVFIIACLAGVVFSWSINTPLTNAVTGALTGVERVLTAADMGLERVNNRLAEAQTNVDTVEENVETAGETLTETNVVYEVLERTVGDELFPKVAAAGETIVAIRDSVVAFNEVLESINEIPFVEVPTLTERLDNAAEQIATVQNDVEETRAELQEIKAEAISKPVTAITDRTTRISDGLENAQTSLTDTQTNIDDNLETIADIKARIPGIFDLISLVLSLVFLWLALGQVGLIILAWNSIKGSDESVKVENAPPVSGSINQPPQPTAVEVEAETETVAAVADENSPPPTEIEEVNKITHPDPETEAQTTTRVTGAAALTHDLSYVEGIGEVYGGKLKEVGVDTPQALLERGATPQGRKELAQATGISIHLILKWVDEVDLYRIKGLGTQYSELLKAAGVDTIPELAQRNPQNLYAKLIEVNEEHRHVRHVPAQTQVEDWVKQAKELPRIVSY